MNINIDEDCPWDDNNLRRNVMVVVAVVVVLLLLLDFAAFVVVVVAAAAAIVAVTATMVECRYLPSCLNIERGYCSSVVQADLSLSLTFLRL